MEHVDLAGVPAFARPAVKAEHAPSRVKDARRATRGQQPAWRPLERRPRCWPAVAAALFLACARPAPVPRPPLPDVAAQLDRLEAAAVRGAVITRAARRLDAAERAVLLASSPRERRAARAEWLDARHELRALAREEE